MSGLLLLKYLTAALTVSIAFAGSWFFEFTKTDKETGKRSLTRVGGVACFAAVLSLFGAAASTVCRTTEAQLTFSRRSRN